VVASTTAFIALNRSQVDRFLVVMPIPSEGEVRQTMIGGEVDLALHDRKIIGAPSPVWLALRELLN
jgi:hypothetical protein